MNRKTFLQCLGAFAFAPCVLKAAKKPSGKSYRINQEECVGCEACISVAEGIMRMREPDEAVAEFYDDNYGTVNKTGSEIYNVTGDGEQMMEDAMNTCPFEFITEFD